MMSYLASGWLFVVLGSLAIAVGGVMTTKGWNNLNLHEEKQSLTAAALREWNQNDDYLALMEEHHLNLPAIETPLLMSTLHDSALEGVLMSPLFDQESSGDKPLYEAVSAYLRNVKPLNDSIVKLNFITSSNMESSKRKETIGNFYTSPLLKRLRGNHQRLGSELKSRIKLKKRQLRQANTPDQPISAKSERN